MFKCLIVWPELSALRPLFCIFEDSYLKLLMRCKGGKFSKLDFFGNLSKDPPYSTGTVECQFKVTRRTAVESA